jgi:hypothetical protein
MSQSILQVGIVAYEESRNLLKEYNQDGSIREMTPEANSERAFLTLELPNGKQIKAEIPHHDFIRDVVPAIEAGYREHRPGKVCSASGSLVDIKKGQVWHCFATSEIGREAYVLRLGSPLVASVVGVEEGTVYLWPENVERFTEMFTTKGTDKHGNPVDVMPFKHTPDGSFKKGSPDEWRNGTFSAHEAWTVWRQMKLST